MTEISLFDLLILKSSRNRKKKPQISAKKKKKKNPQNYHKDVCKILTRKHIASVTVLGEAKSEPQAYYIVIVGVCFVFILSLYRFYLWKFIIPYRDKSAAGENPGLPGSHILTELISNLVLSS